MQQFILHLIGNDISNEVEHIIDTHKDVALSNVQEDVMFDMVYNHSWLPFSRTEYKIWRENDRVLLQEWKECTPSPSPKCTDYGIRNNAYNIGGKTC